MRVTPVLTTAAVAVSLSLGGCTTIQGWIGGPSTASQLNGFATEESGATVAYNTATLWAQSGKETPAEAQFVESARTAIDSNVKAARVARDAGDNVTMASMINLANQGVSALITYMTKNGAPTATGATP